MFTAWGRLVYTHRRVVLVLSLVAAAISLPLAGQAAGVLSSGGWLVRGSESALVNQRLADEFHQGQSSLIVLFHSSDGTPVSTPAQLDAIDASAISLAADSNVQGVFGYRSTGNDDRFLSFDGSSTYLVVLLKVTDEESIDLVPELRARVVPSAGLDFELTGYGPLAGDSNTQSEADLAKAEAVSLPLALLILVVVFGSLLAAGLPLLVAGLAIPSTLAMVYLVAQTTEMTIYVSSVATMLGLALAIDYSLFLVSRFREELRRGRTVGDAVEVAVATAGKAVTFSGIAVAIGLLGLLFFKSSAITSIGIAGALVVTSSVVYGLTFLPALLGMLGPRVDKFSVANAITAFRRRIGRPAAPRVAAANRWERVARWVMGHPIAVLLPTLALLLLLGSPFLRLNQAVPDASVLPAGRESRDAYVYLRDEFPGGAALPFEVLATVPGDPFSAENIANVLDYGERIKAIDKVANVESPFALPDPLTGQPLSAAEVAGLFAHPPTPEIAAQLEQVRARYVSGSSVRLVVHTTADPSQQDGLNVTTALRDINAGDGITTEVGGFIAANYDTLASMRERTPIAVGMTLLVSAVVLFLLFGSIVIPIKAVLMTLLSISASFGALVWIFQEGNLHEWLNFVPLGYTVAGNPIIMFAVIFGLSMDYEVLLLSRVQEAYRRTRDNTASVAEGLASTAAVITGAAMIMVCVFAAFALAETVVIKSIGVGMAIAVFLDATIIRILLVPATMRLLGHWNWWAPGPLGRLADRLGFSHVEDEPPPATAEA
ncbi:MAG TPA: MMPL family transporter [Candidatus Limnocylindria bacterium]|nr:MMPL family transporter [Candidatus Limnocylindria bacterium]